jgi:hypothetical protein
MKIIYYLIKSFMNDEWEFDEFRMIRKKDRIQLWIAGGVLFFNGHCNVIHIPVLYRFILWPFVCYTRNKMSIKLIKGE